MKNLKNLGKVLGKKEQKSIKGGMAPVCIEPLVPCYCPSNHSWSCRSSCDMFNCE